MVNNKFCDDLKSTFNFEYNKKHANRMNLHRYNVDMPNKSMRGK